MQGEYGLYEAVQEIKMKKEEIAIRDRYAKLYLCTGGKVCVVSLDCNGVHIALHMCKLAL